MSNKVIDQYIGRNFAFYNGDSCEILQDIKDNSIDLKEKHRLNRIRLD